MNCSFEQCNTDWNEENPECLCGLPDYKKCENFLKANSTSTEQEIALPTSAGELLPIAWNGQGMGVHDKGLISQQRLPFMVGVVGKAEAGKTTLLAVLYALLRKGNAIGNFQFAGSYTLLGWEKIVENLTFHARKPLSFPPHTSSNNSVRIPSLLHLLLKNRANEAYQNVLFTDASGEWFTNWAENAEGEGAKGAKWIDENADVFMLVADTKAFVEEFGTARHELNKIAQRLKNNLHGRPVALVWAKADVGFSQEKKTDIIKGLQKHLPHLKTFDMAVGNYPENSDLITNILDIVNYLLTANAQKRNELPPIEVKNQDDFFFAIREYGK